MVNDEAAGTERDGESDVASISLEPRADGVSPDRYLLCLKRVLDRLPHLQDDGVEQPNEFNGPIGSLSIIRAYERMPKRKSFAFLASGDALPAIEGQALGVALDIGFVRPVDDLPRYREAVERMTREECARLAIPLAEILWDGWFEHQDSLQFLFYRSSAPAMAVDPAIRGKLFRSGEGGERHIGASVHDVKLPRPTQRMRFRPLIESDVDLLMNLDSDPEVMRFIDGGRAPDAADIAATIERVVGYRWVASDLEGAFVGWFGLIPTRPGEAELGYRLARARWGQGLATEGATELVRFGFDDLGFRRVHAQTMTVNAASRRVLEKCGLSYVGTFFADWPDVIEGSEHGDVSYEITSAAYRVR